MYSEYSLPPTCKQTLIQTTENTVGKETVIIGDKQAPATQKQQIALMKNYAWQFSRLWNFPKYIYFFHFVRISERGSKRHRKKSQSQLCWSIPDFIRALPASFWFLFLWRFIFSLHSFLSWPVKVSDIFYLMKMRGTFRSVVWNSQPHPYVQMVLRACLGYKYANYTRKVNNTEDFQMSGISPTE